MIDKKYIAEPSRRFVAHLFDTIVVFVMAYGIEKLVENSGRKNIYNITKDTGFSLSDFLVDWSPLILWVVVGIVLESSPLQATIGKKIMSIKVVDDQGKRITENAAIKRNVAKIASSLFLCLGHLSIISDDKNQAWHDKWAKSYVVNDI